MLSIGPVVFAAPLMLLALAALPVIYWLLRVTPPAPRRLQFPAIRLLADLVAREETPARTPWWLLLLRLLLAALIILALAQPWLNPSTALPGQGPILLLVDNGWASARDWPARQDAMGEIISQADRADRPIFILPTAPAERHGELRSSGLLRPAAARAEAEALEPRPWPTDRNAALEVIETLDLDGAVYSVWLTDGLGDPHAEALARRLQRLGGVQALLPGSGQTARLIRPPATDGSSLTVRIVRAENGAAEPVALRLAAGDGRVLGRAQGVFPAGETSAEASFDLPVEMRNEAARIAIEGQIGAGSIALLDERWRRRPVGLVDRGRRDEAQPLLSDTFYLERALAPYNEIRRGSILELLDSGVSVLLLPDIGALSQAERDALDAWIDAGGMLLRFAGPLLAAQTSATEPDPLVPVRLRLGDRRLTGAMSWTEPMPLAPFSVESPLHGLTVPNDIRVERQVLAEPSLELPNKTWSRLADGTPLVTADERGGGRVVLVHTTAGPDWSNLPLSGLYVDMLRRMVDLSEGVSESRGNVSLNPLQTLDGFGRLAPPPATAAPISAGGLDDVAVGPEHPPGFYGTGDTRLALNLGAQLPDPITLGDFPRGVSTGPYQAAGEVDLAPWLLALAVLLATIDLFVAIALRGLLPRLSRGAAAGVIGACMALALLGPQPSRAQMHNPEELALTATNDIYLAYVRTGSARVDEVSRDGLESLSRVLRNRTAVEAAGAIGVDIASDELAFFPLLYWPLVPEQPPIGQAASARVNDFLRNGGTILFDTRDQALGGFGHGLAGGGPGAESLRRLTSSLEIPPLTPVPPDHVLTKAFYLMQDFPGRYVGGDVWIETTDEHVNDGVSSVIIGANDWAGAWATGPDRRPRFAVVPGGERQREMAYRFGVNLMMYALTGNYKADQVHVPAILERLGQ